MTLGIQRRKEVDLRPQTTSTYYSPSTTVRIPRILSILCTEYDWGYFHGYYYHRSHEMEYRISRSCLRHPTVPVWNTSTLGEAGPGSSTDHCLVSFHDAILVHSIQPLSQSKIVVHEPRDSTVRHCITRRLSDMNEGKSQRQTHDNAIDCRAITDVVVGEQVNRPQNRKEMVVQPPYFQRSSTSSSTNLPAIVGVLPSAKGPASRYSSFDKREETPLVGDLQI